MKLKQNIKAIAADLYLTPGNMLATSSETGYGKNDVLNKIHSVIEVLNDPTLIEEDEDEEEETEE